MAPLALENLHMTVLPGVYIEVLTNPTSYSDRQLNTAMSLAWALRRGRFLLLEPPELTG